MRSNHVMPALPTVRSAIPRRGEIDRGTFDQRHAVRVVTFQLHFPSLRFAASSCPVPSHPGRKTLWTTTPTSVDHDTYLRKSYRSSTSFSRFSV